MYRKAVTDYSQDLVNLFFAHDLPGCGKEGEFKLFSSLIRFANFQVAACRFRFPFPFPYPFPFPLAQHARVSVTRRHFALATILFSFFFSLASELLSQNDKIALELAHSPMHFLFAYLSLFWPPSRYPAIQFFPASLSRSLSLLLASHTRKPLDNFQFFFSVYLL